MTTQEPDPDPEPEPEPDVVAQLWADNAQRGWTRCPDCGDEWATDDHHSCECERKDHAET